MKTIIIAGGNGFLGTVLSDLLSKRGFKIKILSRNAPVTLSTNNIEHFRWDPSDVASCRLIIENAFAVINLCGKSVNCRYNQKNKDEILQSRLQPTTTLVKAFQCCERPPELLINAATGTIYQESFDRPMTEVDGILGSGFSVGVARQWEKALFDLHSHSTRTVALRTSFVLGIHSNSALPALALLSKLGLAGKHGSGKQIVSWIHKTDFARAVLHIIDNEQLHGPINITAPAPLPNADFMQILNKTLNQKIALPAPKFLLEIGAFILRTETELLLKSRFLVPEKLTAHRFFFQYPFLDEALQNLLLEAHSERPLMCSSKSLNQA